MAETPGAGYPDDLDAPDLPLDRRLRALEAAYAELQPGQPAAAQRTTGEAALAADFAAYRTQMRDLEKSLVERIADVDDDRRLTAAKVQRGWQAQRDEFGARLRRLGWLAALALAIGIGGMVALYAYLRSTQTDLTNEIARRTAVQQQLTAELDAHKQALETLARALRLPPEPTGHSQPPPPTKPAEPVGGPSPPAVPVPDPVTSPSTPAAPVVGQAAAAPDDAPPPTAAPEDRSETITVTDRPFALQLNGSHNQTNILKLAARPNLPAHVYIRQELRDGRPWYVLIHSLHGSLNEAKQAQAQLPSELRSRSPWIRTLPQGTSLDLVPSGRAP